MATDSSADSATEPVRFKKLIVMHRVIIFSLKSVWVVYLFYLYSSCQLIIANEFVYIYIQIVEDNSSKPSAYQVRLQIL